MNCRQRVHTGDCTRQPGWLIRAISQPVIHLVARGTSRQVPYRRTGMAHCLSLSEAVNSDAGGPWTERR
jgi:hypothetical protein